MYCGPWFLKIIFTLPSHTHETKLFLLSKIVIRTGAQTLVSPFSFSLVLTTSKKKLNWFRSFDSVLFQSLFFLSTAFFIDSLCRHLDNLKPRAKYFAGAKCRRFLVMIIRVKADFNHIIHGFFAPNKMKEEIKYAVDQNMSELQCCCVGEWERYGNRNLVVSNDFENSKSTTEVRFESWRFEC